MLMLARCCVAQLNLRMMEVYRLGSCGYLVEQEMLLGMSVVVVIVVVLVVEVLA